MRPNRYRHSSSNPHCALLSAGRGQAVEFCTPQTLEIGEIGLHFESRQGFLQNSGGLRQFALLVCRFSLLVSRESTFQATVRAAVGVGDEDHPLRLVQFYGLANLFKNKLAVTCHRRRSEIFGASRDPDVVRIDNPRLSQKHVNRSSEAMIEARHDRGVANVPRSR
jgi:hypothetical protein